MNQLVTEARALCEGATKGPWETLLSAGKEYWIKTPRYGVRDFCCLTGGLEHEADAALIARSRTLIPEMAEGIERLQAELDAAKRDIRHVLGVEQYDVCDICAYNHDENYLCDDCTKAKWRGLCSENSAEALAAMKEDAHESHT